MTAAIASVRALPRRGLSREEKHTPVEGVYFIGFDNYIKIGRSSNVARRIYGLQTGFPTPLIIYLILTDPEVSELGMHRKFKHLRLQGEWFKKTKELTDYIDYLRSELIFPEDDAGD